MQNDLPIVFNEGKGYLSPIQDAGDLLGVNYSYLRRKSLESSGSWVFIKESGRLMLEYDSLNPKYKVLVKEKYGCPYQ